MWRAVRWICMWHPRLLLGHVTESIQVCKQLPGHDLHIDSRGTSRNSEDCVLVVESKWTKSLLSRLCLNTGSHQFSDSVTNLESDVFEVSAELRGNISPSSRLVYCWNWENEKLSSELRWSAHCFTVMCLLGEICMRVAMLRTHESERKDEALFTLVC